MKTTIFFVRHAQPDVSIHDDLSRPLTAKGAVDCERVTAFLKDKKIEIALSSPYKRSIDTILPFVNSVGLQIEIIEDFRERKVDDIWIEDFNAFTQKQWKDFSYKLANGECLHEVQSRNINALEKVLIQYQGKNIVIGTHGTALSTIINYYDSSYGYEDFQLIASLFPWIVKMEFMYQTCLNVEKINPFSSDLLQK